MTYGRVFAERISKEKNGRFETARLYIIIVKILSSLGAPLERHPFVNTT